MKRIIISAPFGNWLEFPEATSTIGTFTLNQRAGFIKRWWKVLSTVRYNWRTKSWINKLGLPNPGIETVSDNYYVEKSDWMKDKIISIHGFNLDEWENLIIKLIYVPCEAIELNFSCPNVNHQSSIDEAVKVIEHINRYEDYKNKTIIAKLGPLRWDQYGDALYNAGVKYFHLCNTIPTPGGGLSGKVLKPFSLWAIEYFRKKYEVDITGGGGITSIEDVRDYINAGVNRISMASGLFNPLNWKKICVFDTYIQHSLAI